MDQPQRSFELLKAGDAEGLLRLLGETPGAVDARDATGVSLLMHTIYRVRRDLTEAVAGKKQALNIFEAASLGRIEQLKERLRDSTALNSCSPDGFTALHF